MIDTIHPVVLARLLRWHEAELNRLTVQLERAEAKYDETESNEDAALASELCQFLEDEIAYGKYLFERRP